MTHAITTRLLEISLLTEHENRRTIYGERSHILYGRSDAMCTIWNLYLAFAKILPNIGLINSQADEKLTDTVQHFGRTVVTWKCTY